MATKTEKFRATANPQYARDIHGLRSSSAAESHADERDRRARTRGAKLKRALRDYRD